MASSGNSVTAAFVDLATFDQLEKTLYGGSNAATYFIRDIQKCTWFSQIPVALARAAGAPSFGQQWSVTVSRAGDYLLYCWLRVKIPEVRAANAGTHRLRWTRNLMHNLIQDAVITFNDLTGSKIDNTYLDFWTAFTMPAEKRNGYLNMIGSIDVLTQGGDVLPACTLNLPLPFFFSRDSGVSLPTAAIPYNDMRIQFTFRNWTELLIAEELAAPVAGHSPHRPAVAGDVVGGTVTMTDATVWANYAVVSNDERATMGDMTRTMLIEQAQTGGKLAFTPSSNSAPSFDLRYSHAVRALFFAVRNVTNTSEWSNYSTASPIRANNQLTWKHAGAHDPISTTTLIYENTARLASMGSDYFSLVAPYYQACATIPEETGYHLYSYSLNMCNTDPSGSTNFGRLCNVTVIPEASEEAKLGSAGNGPPGMNYPQKYEFVSLVVINTLISIRGGAVGFPVL